MQRPKALIAALIASFLLSFVAFSTSAAANDRTTCDSREIAPDPAIAACTRLINGGKLTGRNLATTYNNRGWRYNLKGDYDRAIVDLNEALRRDPKMAYAYNNRGWAYYEKGEYDRAIPDLNEALRLDPKLVHAYVNRGWAYSGKRDYDGAISDFSDALRLDPRSVGAGNGRGLSYNHKGDYDRAIADLSEVIRIDPKHASALTNRGWAYLEKGEYDRAINDLNEAIRLSPNLVNAYINRGWSYHGKQDNDRAIDDFSAALRISPRSVSALKGRATAYSSKRDYDRAIADYDEAIRLSPRDGDSFRSRAVARRESGDFDRAISDFDEAIRLDPGFARSYVGRGLTFEKKGDVDRARADFSIATALPSRNTADRRAIDLARERMASLTARPKVEPPPVVPSLPEIKTASDPGRRIALVIGNSAYTSQGFLPNPRRDAETVAAALRNIGFQTVTLEQDLGRDRLMNALRLFARQAENADWAVVYYAGHGIELSGTNYLIPVDAKLEIDRDVEFETVALERVMTAVDGAKKLRLVILDACRDNPFVKTMTRSMATRSIGRGLASVEPASATLVVYAAKHGQVALDGEGSNSPFVTAFVRNLAQPKVDIRKFFDLVRDDVMDATNRRQQPFTYGSVPGREDFFFVSR